jgi:hypothetical protein
VTEVDRTVNASGNVSLGDHMISAGLPLAGQRVTLRLDDPVAHVLAAGVLARPGTAQAGLSHARKTVQITADLTPARSPSSPGTTVTAARTGRRDIRRHKALNYSP